tara:strand:+ start:41 stop:229 length:189 start_codon:yes stop_codon:yes gene_type:complete
VRFDALKDWENTGELKLELLSTSSVYDEALLTVDQFKLTDELLEIVDPFEGDVNEGVLGADV